MFRKKYHRYKEKLSVLKKIVLLVYKQAPLEAILRDILFLLETATSMYMITVGGYFLDSTAKILLEWSDFNLTDYFFTDSFYYLIIGLALWMITNVSSKARANFKDRIDRIVGFKMQFKLVEKISKSNLQDVENEQFRDLLAFVPSFSFSNILLAYDSFSELLRSFITMSVALAILGQTMGLSVLLLPLFVIPEVLFGHIGRKSIKKYNDTQVERLKVLDYLSYVMTRIPFFSELRVDGTFIQLVKSYVKEGTRYVRGEIEKIMHFYIDTALFAQTGRLMMTGYTIFILSASIIQKATIGHFKALVDYMLTAYGSAYSFMNSASQISNYIEYSRSYFEYIEFKGFGDLDHGDKLLGKGTPKLQFQNLDFAYPGTDKKVLEDLDLDIPAGQKVAIIGTDGVGKSSLIKIFCGLYKITAGDYVIDGLSIREIARGELKRKIAAVFEDFVHYNFSFKRNVTLAGEKDRVNNELYKKALDISGLSSFVKENNISENQMLGKYFSNGLELSPGYWQRLAIARMIYRNRDIFIMDEPFTYIDGQSRPEILKKVIDFIGKDRTLIFITQELTNLEYFDVVYTLKDGKLHRIGSKSTKKKK